MPGGSSFRDRDTRRLQSTACQAGGRSPATCSQLENHERAVQRSSDPSRPLVFRHRVINPVGPCQNAALEILGFLKPLPAQELLRFQPAHAALAVNDDLSILIQLLEALG